jgi:hypothetical protein
LVADDGDLNDVDMALQGGPNPGQGPGDPSACIAELSLQNWACTAFMAFMTCMRPAGASGRAARAGSRQGALCLDVRQAPTRREQSRVRRTVVFMC